jgi:hypothetical protein
VGLFDALLGNASDVNPADAQREFGRILAQDETVHQAYKLIRDMMLFTSRRLILIDVQGLTGKKIEYHSIPYRSITHFSVETAGSFDLDAELKIWVTGRPEPLEKKFNKQLDIYQLQAVLASYVCR